MTIINENDVSQIMLSQYIKYSKYIKSAVMFLIKKKSQFSVIVIDISDIYKIKKII